MPSFVKGGGNTAPFGPREYLRSTREFLTNSATFAASTLPEVTIDGEKEKILQPGMALAKITSGDDAGKVGVFQDGASDGRGDAANLVGLNDTFLPYQLKDGDHEVAVVYGCVAVKDWCTQLDSSGAVVKITEAVADGLRGGQSLEVKFN